MIEILHDFRYPNPRNSSSRVHVRSCRSFYHQQYPWVSWTSHSDVSKQPHVHPGYGCFCEFGVLSASVLVIRALLFGVEIRALDFWKLPYGPAMLAVIEAPAVHPSTLNPKTLQLTQAVLKHHLVEKYPLLLMAGSRSWGVHFLGGLMIGALICWGPY